MGYRRKSNENVNIAKERVVKLFKLADDIFSEDSSLSDRYVDLARKIAMKFKIKLSSSQKRKFCKHCYSYLRPGINCRVRTVSNKLVYSCFKCKKFTRIPLIKSVTTKKGQ